MSRLHESNAQKLALPIRINQKQGRASIRGRITKKQNVGKSLMPGVAEYTIRQRQKTARQNAKN